jgi:hypothetical protein
MVNGHGVRRWCMELKTIEVVYGLVFARKSFSRPLNSMMIRTSMMFLSLVIRLDVLRESSVAPTFSKQQFSSSSNTTGPRTAAISRLDTTFRPSILRLRRILRRLIRARELVLAGPNGLRFLLPIFLLHSVAGGQYNHCR